MTRFALAISFIACLWISACSKTEVEKPEDPSTQTPTPPASEAFLLDIDAAAAGKLVKQEAPPTVVDVRTPEEFAEGHIEGATNIDFNSPGFEDEIAKLDREKPYLLHCRSGGRSAKAKPAFLQLGFTALYHLDGGIMAWETAGLPTVK